MFGLNKEIEEKFMNRYSSVFDGMHKLIISEHVISFLSNDKIIEIEYPNQYLHSFYNMHGNQYFGIHKINILLFESYEERLPFLLSLNIKPLWTHIDIITHRLDDNFFYINIAEYEDPCLNIFEKLPTHHQDWVLKNIDFFKPLEKLNESLS